MADLNTLSDKSVQKLKEDHNRLKNQVENLQRLLLHTPRVAPAKQQLVRYRNDSGETVPAYGCMKLTGAIRVAGRPVRTITKPDTGFLRGRYLVNLARRIATGGYGYGTWLDEDGEVLCDASANTPTFDQEWGPTPAQWYLTRHRNGFRILGAVTGSGTSARALAQQRIVTEIRGKPSPSDIAKGATGSVAVWWRNAASGTWEDSTLSLANVRALAAALTATKYCSLAWDSGEWIAGPIEC